MPAELPTDPDPGMPSDVLAAIQALPEAPPLYLTAASATRWWSVATTAHGPYPLNANAFAILADCTANADGSVTDGNGVRYVLALIGGEAVLVAP